VALVYKKVLAGSLNAQPCVGESAESTGPTMENVPMQKSRQPVKTPSNSPLKGEDRRSMRPAKSSFVPISPPMARLRMKRTGNSLRAMLGRAAFMPSTRQQSPSPSNSVFLYFSPMPVRTKAPKVLPTMIAQVLIIVPSTYLILQFYNLVPPKGG